MAFEFNDHTLLFCNGEPPSRRRLLDVIRTPVKVVCADGGAHKAMSVGFFPDLIIGDLDSLDRTTTSFENSEIVRVPSQENTDLEKTLNLLLERGESKFLITSFSGGRIDQTLANIQICYEYSKKCDIVLIDDQYVIFPATTHFESDLKINTSISILPMEDGTVVSTEGLAYELTKSKMPRGGHGISNRTIRERIKITVHQGGVLFFIKDI